MRKVDQKRSKIRTKRALKKKHKQAKNKKK